MLDYSFHRVAQVEFEDAALRYEEIRVGLGSAFADNVEKCIDLIRQYPEIGSAQEGTAKGFVVDSFPFSVVYRRVGDEIRVIAIANHSRRPGYWQRRK